MNEHVEIEELGAKIELLIRSESTNIKSSQDLLIALNVTKDWYSRIKSGQRRLTEDRFLLLTASFGLKQKDWHAPLTDFGAKLGFTRHEIYSITQKYLPGIDFGSRIKDEVMVKDIFKLIEGFWESFYFSVSKVKKKVVSHDYLHIKSVNDDGFIECEIIDTNVIYVGWCFPMKAHLYFILEKDKIFNEIIVYCTNLPERSPPRLYGIILCLSGGIDEHHTWPCGAKCAFRYIGKEKDVRQKFGLPPKADPRQFLIEKNATANYYIDPSDPGLDEDTQQILADISNVIDPAAIPSALRMIK